MNRDALIALKERVEAGEPCRTWGATLTDFAGAKWNEVYLAFNGSLDAAKALHDAVLHERIAATFTYSARYGAKAILLDGMTEETWGGDAWHETASRAWLLAILSALIAMETDHEEPREEPKEGY